VESLKARPTNIRIKATCPNAGQGKGAPNCALSAARMYDVQCKGSFNSAAAFKRLVVPVKPYTKAIPYSKNAVANDPSRKYFNEASLQRGSDRR
jgi:hypothetical protein